MRCVSVILIDLGDWEIRKGEQLGKLQIIIEKTENRNKSQELCVHEKWEGENGIGT